MVVGEEARMAGQSKHASLNVLMMTQHLRPGRKFFSKNFPYHTFHTSKYICWCASGLPPPLTPTSACRGPGHLCPERGGGAGKRPPTTPPLPRAQHAPARMVIPRS